MDSVATPVYLADGAAYGSPSQSPTVSVSDWLITYVISFVPVVGFVMLFVWAFSSSTPPSKANWAKAALVITAIFTASSILLLMVFARTFLDVLAKTVTNTRPR